MENMTHQRHEVEAAGRFRHVVHVALSLLAGENACEQVPWTRRGAPDDVETNATPPNGAGGLPRRPAAKRSCRTIAAGRHAVVRQINPL
jgi:hypothetical protein